MTADITLVVGGFPQLAEALRASGRVAKVHATATTEELRDLIAGGALKGAHKDSTVFVFADTLTVNTPQNLSQLVGALLALDYPVIIAAASPHAHNLIASNPSAGLIEGPFTANTALGAISGLGLGTLEPDPNGFEPLDIHNKPGKPTSRDNDNDRAGSGSGSGSGGRDSDNGRASRDSGSGGSGGGGWNTAATTTAPAAPKQAPSTTAPAAPKQAPSASAANTPDWAVPAKTEPPAPPTSPDRWNKPDPDTASHEPQHTTETAKQPATPPAAAPPKKIAFPTPTAGPVPFPGGPTPSHNAPNQTSGLVLPQTEQGQPPQRRQGWVVAVSSPKGGTGKSGLTLNLAAYCGLRLQAENKKVCIIDTNFQQPDVGKMLGQYTPTIADIVRDKSSIHPDRINNYLVHRSELNVSGLLGPTRVDEADPTFINARLYVRVLEVLRELYDIIFLDTPVAELYHDIFRGLVLPQADYLIVPVAPSMHTLMDADNWLQAITQPKHAGGDNVNPERVGVILNQAQEGVGCSEEEVQRELASWRYIGAIPYTKEWIKAGNHREIVATKNYHELNEAFARILWWATGEEAFRNDPNNQPRSDIGVATPYSRLNLGRFKRLLQRR